MVKASIVMKEPIVQGDIDDPEWHPIEAYADAFIDDMSMVESHYWEIVVHGSGRGVMCRNLADVFEWLWSHRDEVESTVEIVRRMGVME